MRDPSWWREFEREEAEKEDRLAEIKEKYEEWKKTLEPKPSLWRKRKIAFFELSDKDFKDWPEHEVQREDI
jgi:hypothetical protein